MHTHYQYFVHSVIIAFLFDLKKKNNMLNFGWTGFVVWYNSCNHKKKITRFIKNLGLGQSLKNKTRGWVIFIMFNLSCIFKH